MKRRFVVGIDGETPEDAAKIREYVREKKMGWHHWFPNLWLLTTRNKSITAADIRKLVRSSTEDKHVIVLEVDAVTWATFGPNSQEEGGKNLSRWIRETWDTD